MYLYTRDLLCLIINFHGRDRLKVIPYRILLSFKVFGNVQTLKRHINHFGRRVEVMDCAKYTVWRSTVSKPGIFRNFSRKRMEKKCVYACEIKIQNHSKINRYLFITYI